MSQKLGRYRLVKLLATGGMGEVFLARQEGPGGFAKMVVIKRILKHLARDQGFIDLFLNEAKLAAQLQHPNIAQVFGLEHVAKHWFIAMEYVHGHSLRDVLDQACEQRLPVPAPIAARLVSQALQGLHFAHELTDERGRPLGILHRDVSPENLLVSYSGLVKLVDFGIARAMTGAETRVGRPKGKLAYMAPELTISGTVVDRRADVYAAGVVLHELLVLARPACVPDSNEALGRPRADYTDEPRIPPALNHVLRKALAAQPDARFASAHEMSAALEASLLSTGVSVLPAEVSTWLTGLCGGDDGDLNPAVVHLGLSAGRTDVMRALGGTQPLSSQSQLAPPVEARPRLRRAWLAVLGLATAALLGVALTVALRPASDLEPARVLEPEPQPLAAQSPLPPPQPPPPPVVEALVASSFPELDLAPPPEPPQVRDAGSKAARPRSRGAARTGRVWLRVNPWAVVFYAGRRIGTTPLDPLELPVGVAVLTLKNPQLGVTRTVSVKVNPGAVSVVKVDLFPK
jgi:serine/threonine protein kinase